MQQKTGYIYIMANKPAGTTYLGVTSDLIQRVAQHKTATTPGFTSEYDIHDLVYYEACGSMEAAILREKDVKKWRRAWKIRLIETLNPKWDDLYSALIGENGA